MAIAGQLDAVELSQYNEGASVGINAVINRFQFPFVLSLSKHSLILRTRHCDKLRASGIVGRQFKGCELTLDQVVVPRIADRTLKYVQIMMTRFNSGTKNVRQNISMPAPLSLDPKRSNVLDSLSASSLRLS
jgi:hypothetical protein